MSDIVQSKSIDISLLKNTVCKGASDSELALFAQICQRTGLDPFARQIYSLPLQGSRQIVISIDGARLIAERSGKYAGQLGAYWCGEDGVWQDVWLKNTPPVAAKVGVLRHDFKEPLFAVARFSEYARGQMWVKMPALMIAKVAEMLALRRAFALELSGLYAQEELDQAMPAVDVTPEPLFDVNKPEHKDLMIKTLDKIQLPLHEFRKAWVGGFKDKQIKLAELEAELLKFKEV